MSRPTTFQELILALQSFWAARGCIILQPLDMEVGAATFHPGTFLRAVGPEPWSAAYVQPSRRPTDGRYGDNPNRLQHYYQFQVVLKPSPLDIQEQYLDSLRTLGIDPLVDDIRFVEDNWESPSLGAWGLGFEVWQNGMEISQFTYFQQVGGLPCSPVTGELTYGLERIAMSLFNQSSVYDIPWIRLKDSIVTYGDVFHQNEVEMSQYHFEEADTKVLFRQFEDDEQMSNHLLGRSLPLPAYEMVIKASHTFNILDARRAISVTERQRYILRIRQLAKRVAEAYHAAREGLGFPLLKRKDTEAPSTVFPHDVTISSNVPESPVRSELASRQLLFEIGCEELPSASVNHLGQALLQLTTNKFHEATVSFETIQCFATPRRLAVCVSGVPDRLPPQVIVKRGPTLAVALDDQGRATSALIGFAKSCGIAVEQLTQQTTAKGTWYVYEQKQPAVSVTQLFPELFRQIVTELPIAKPMFWGNRQGPFVRPLHWVVLLYGSEVIPVTFWGVQAGRHTYGHRYHEPEPVALKTASEYERVLGQLKVIPCFQTRRNRVLELIHEKAKTVQAVPVISDDLLDEITSIVEWPTALLCQFDPIFLNLPQEVLITSMHKHQKCVALRCQTQEKLLPYFITLSNIESQQPQEVMVGNEKVMTARLSDADFFFNQDRKHPLGSFFAKLEQTLFQAKLGSIADQVRRVERLCLKWAEHLQLSPEHIKQALYLSKCDLMTGMVGEFPDLQGIMGYYYAVAEGVPEDCAIAVKEHYLPRFSQDELPATPLGKLLSLAFRIDTLVGIFGINQKPTGVKDPYKLRRHALAVIRLLATTTASLSLTDCLTDSVAAYAAEQIPAVSIAELKTFIIERLPAYYETQGISADIVASVNAIESDDLFDQAQRILALKEKKLELEPLLGGAKRVTHLLKSAPQAAFYAAVHPNLLEQPEEKKLYLALQDISEQLIPLLATRHYEAILDLLSALRPLIDQFFDAVMVMVEQESLRNNRLTMLKELQARLFCVADLALLQQAT